MQKTFVPLLLVISDGKKLLQDLDTVTIEDTCTHMIACMWQGWPFPESTEVWVLPSTSGAAPMATEERIGPWQELSDRLRLVEWPCQISCRVG